MGNHDNLILKIFINKTGNFNSNKTRKINKYPNIKEYLDNRYDDSFSLAETLNRIKFHIDKHPKCPVCGNYVKYAGVSNNKIYFRHNKKTNLIDKGLQKGSTGSITIPTTEELNISTDDYVVEGIVKDEFDLSELQSKYQVFKVVSVDDNRKGGLQHYKIGVSEWWS